MISHLFPDLVFLVEGKKLYYHQAVLAQHSQLVKSLLSKTSCCKCNGVDCSRNAGNVFITLDGVKTDTVQYVMDMIYAGSGNMVGDTEDYKSVLDMLQINTIVVDALNSFEGFILEEIFSQGGSDIGLRGVSEGSITLNDALEEESRKVDQELKETNKALKKLEREKKKLAVEEKKKQEIDRKRDRRSRNRKPSYAEEDSREGLEDNTEDTIKVEENKTVETIELTRSRTESVVVQKSKTTSDTPQPSAVTTKTSYNQPISKSSNDDDDCEIIIDSEIEKKITSVEIKAEESERYVCPFKDCRSESKNAQSIKVHLALVHYKKSIQSEFPNWKKQKCDECEKSFGQMTAYYLHMANHKKYQYMDLPAHAMVPKDDKSATGDNSKQSSTRKSYSSSSSPYIRGSSLTSSSKSSSSTLIAPSSTSSILRTSGAIIKPSSLAHARSNSFVQNSNATQVNKSSTISAGLSRSKSFVQTKSQPQITSNKLQSLIARTTTGSKTSIGSSAATFGRPTPPGPPGPSTVSSTRSNSLNRNTGPVISSDNKSSTTPGPHQRRLSAPYSVVTKRTTNSVERPPAKDTKKTRGS